MPFDRIIMFEFWEERSIYVAHLTHKDPYHWWLDLNAFSSGPPWFAPSTLIPVLMVLPLSSVPEEQTNPSLGSGWLNDACLS